MDGWVHLMPTPFVFMNFVFATSMCVRLLRVCVCVCVCVCVRARVCVCVCVRGGTEALCQQWCALSEPVSNYSLGFQRFSPSISLFKPG